MNITRRRFWLPVALLLAALMYTTQPVSAQRGPLTSYRALRYTGVVGQQTWYTCGPAVVATLLRYDYGIPITRSQAVKLAIGYMDGRNPKQGITALALVRTLERRGVKTRGYKLSPAELLDYLQRGGLPVILHFTRPELHFVVAVGLVGSQVVLADPSWGRRIVPFTALVSEFGYDGVTLAPVPDAGQFARAKQVQAGTLAWAAGRVRPRSR